MMMIRIRLLVYFTPNACWTLVSVMVLTIFVLRKILQEPLFVPETIFVDDLLRQLRNTQNQMAILLDEYGGVAGIVTLEDFA